MRFRPDLYGTAKRRGIDLDRCVGPDRFLGLTLSSLRLIDAVMELEPRREFVVQAGACLGVWPIYLSSLFDHVLSFEPSRDNFEWSHENLSRHGRTNTHLVNAALGDRKGSVTLSTTRKRDFVDVSTWIVGDARGVKALVPVPMYALDGFIMGSFGPGPRLDLLVLDVEGYELPALIGAREVLERDLPMVVLETNGCCEKFFTWTRADTDAFLFDLGYVKTVDLGNDAIYTCE